MFRWIMKAALMLGLPVLPVRCETVADFIKDANGWCEQTVTLKFKSAAAAAAAEIAIAPLYNNKTLAVSGRWDDNNGQNLKMHDLFDKYGYKATFYLFGKVRPGRKDKDTGPETVQKLVDNGFSIGGHTLTHASMPMMKINRLFREAVGIRIEREVDSDKAINSFVFPGNHWRNDFADGRRSAEILKRAGYIHLSQGTFVEPDYFICANLIHPGDELYNLKRAESQIKACLDDKARLRQEPLMAFAMHANQKTAGWRNLEQLLKKYGGNPDWWYCNQTDYAAYRFLYRHSTVKILKRDNDRVTILIKRPSGNFVGSNIPVTLKAGVQVVSAESKEASCQLSGTLINVVLPLRDSSPTLIDAVENTGNRPGIGDTCGMKKFPGLYCNLFFNEAGKLILSVKNLSPFGLDNAAATIRLPGCYKKRLLVLDLDNIPKNKSLEKEIAIPEKIDFTTDMGSPFFVAELNFLSKQKKLKGRIYACTQVSVVEDQTAGCPRDGALAAGPFDGSSFSPDDLAGLSTPDSKQPVVKWYNTKLQNEKFYRRGMTCFNVRLDAVASIKNSVIVLLRLEFTPTRDQVVPVTAIPANSKIVLKEAYLNGKKVDLKKVSLKLNEKSRLLLMLEMPAAKKTSRNKNFTRGIVYVNIDNVKWTEREDLNRIKL